MNLHFHDRESSDGAGALAEHCRAALEAGVGRLCLTNHVEVLDPDTGRWTVSLEEATERFRRQLEAAREASLRWPHLEVRVGAELEYRPEWRTVLERFADEVPLDFLVGSVHVVEGHNVSGGPGAGSFFEDRSQEEAYGAYFRTVREMVEWGGFDVVGHFDIVKRFGHLRYGPYDPGDFEDVVRDILRIMVRRGLGLEINTSGVRQPPGVPFPQPEILRWARQEGVEVLTLGTDSHAPEHFAQGLEQGYELARSTGWNALTVFEGRRPRRIPLERPGGGSIVEPSQGSGRGPAVEPLQDPGRRAIREPKEGPS